MPVIERHDQANPGEAHPPAFERRHFAQFVGTSLIASTLGSAVGALGYVAGELSSTGSPATAAQWFVLPVGVAFVTLVAMTLAVPAGLVLGPLMLGLARDWTARRPLATAIMFGILGLLAGGLIHGVLDNGVRDPDAERWISMLFGATVGAAHPLLVLYRAKQSVIRTVLVASAASLVVGAAGRLTLDAVGNADARREYAAGCRSGASAFALRPDLLRIVVSASQEDTSAGRARLSTEQGQWWPFHGNDAVLHRYSALFIDGVRVLAVNDFALAPVTLRSRLGFARQVEAHCLPTLNEATAELARRAALVRSPPRALPPPRWL